ncbi:hypothetical protein Ddye_030623 [Dipteronia dyeriana]|uniref:Uncharacterized protein n=1 Tax=Dipteronia dyeriana TaxID=168575 RepID=A0AAD9TH04_9ROSI|nr:hypothetical protein Ddye_030623 [Dipteronia dyeriana]
MKSVTQLNSTVSRSPSTSRDCHRSSLAVESLAILHPLPPTSFPSPFIFQSRRNCDGNGGGSWPSTSIAKRKRQLADDFDVGYLAVLRPPSSVVTITYD